ncbi:hypothetical protein KM043_011831 [Ampulex compressa]|nr:hypothetical protein KM043_011831 [Ampulex compressa]
MLKEVILIAFAAFCCASAVMPTRTADLDFLHKQKKIYELLFFVKQGHLIDAEFYEVGHKYDIESNINMYNDKDVVQEFLYFYKQGVLYRDAIFSLFNEDHLFEVERLYKLFYDAKDFQTFYRTAAWARIKMNYGVFVSAFTAAVFFRPDCKYIRLPAPYEINPNLYFDSTVIQKAHHVKMMRGTKAGMENTDNYLIHTNYTGLFTRALQDEEYKLDYFMEDVSLNTFYYYYRHVLPFWLNSKDYNIPKEIRGYLYSYIHQQLISRYYLERISNDLGDIEDFDYYKRFYPGYYSTLMYNNGIFMPQRERVTAAPYYKYKYLKQIDILENRIMNAIDLGYVYDKEGKQVQIYTPEGLNILGNIIEGNVDSTNRRFYGMYDALARDILGYNFDYKYKNRVIPSALQSYSTSMRDPAFYRLYKRIMTFFLRYKKNLPAYTQNELVFPGVKFESVHMDKLMTYFDTCDTLINNAVTVQNFKEGMALRIKARRSCLNYKPFTYRINVNSEKETKAVLRIFLGPANYDQQYEGQTDYSYLRKYYQYFVELDKFVVTLKSGTNTIERRSSESFLTVPDMMSSDIYYEKIQEAVNGNEPFIYEEKMFGFPERLTLPRGKPEGMRFKMFFYLSPYDETKVTKYELPVFGKLYFDGKPFGYPLDRPMYPWKFYTPNMYFKDVYIYHAKEGMKTQGEY